MFCPGSAAGPRGRRRAVTPPSPARIRAESKTEVELTRITRVRDADFTRIGVLGVGSFGKVVLAKQKTTGDLYALKFVSLALSLIHI